MTDICKKKKKNFFFFFFFLSKGQGVISAFSKGQGVTKRGQGAAPCKRSLGRTLSIMAVIRRSFVSLNGVNFVPLYKSLVRSHLEYASCIWSPYKKKHIEAIERVQRRATKQLPGMKDLPYPERLKILKLPTLVY